MEESTFQQIRLWWLNDIQLFSVTFRLIQDPLENIWGQMLV